jgi:hypothetical protein
MGEHLAGAEAEVTYVEAFVLDRPVGRLILRLRSLCGSGEGEDKEEKAGTLQQEVLPGVCTMLRPRPHRRTTLRRRRAWWISVRSWLLVIVQIKRSSRRVQTRWRRRHKQVSVDVIRHITHRGGLCALWPVDQSSFDHAVWKSHRRACCSKIRSGGRC